MENGTHNSAKEKFRKNTGHPNIKKFSPCGPVYSEIFDSFPFIGRRVPPNSPKLFWQKDFPLGGMEKNPPSSI